MLAYKNRFHGHGSLRFVYKNGHSQRTHHLTLKHTSNPRRRTPRIAVVVSKKVLKSAVGRNRIRRRVYEQLRLLLPQLPPNSDIVCIITSAEVRTMPSHDLQKLLHDTLRQAALLS